MKKSLFRNSAVVALCAFLASCTTTTDQYGRQQQSLTPEGAVLGAAAVGLIGYSLAKNKYKDHDYHRGGYRRGGYYNNGGYYGGRGGYGGYGGRGCRY